MAKGDAVDWPSMPLQRLKFIAGLGINDLDVLMEIAFLVVVPRSIDTEREAFAVWAESHTSDRARICGWARIRFERKELLSGPAIPRLHRVVSRITPRCARQAFAILAKSHFVNRG